MWQVRACEKGMETNPMPVFLAQPTHSRGEISSLRIRRSAGRHLSCSSKHFPFSHENRRHPPERNISGIYSPPPHIFHTVPPLHKSGNSYYSRCRVLRFPSFFSFSQRPLSPPRKTRSNKLFSFRRAKQGLISCSFMHG